jgi:hypothetical protein
MPVYNDPGLAGGTPGDKASSTRANHRTHFFGFPMPANIGVDHGHQQSRYSKEGVRTEMGTRNRKARLAVLEKAHAPTAGLSHMQAQITNPKTSVSADYRS